MVEQTLVLVKPSGVRRCLIGEVIGRVERRGLSIRHARLFQVTREMATQHYAEHKDKSFYDELVEHITSAPVFGMVIEGPEAVRVVRTMMGATNPLDAAPGTVRGDFGLSVLNNVVHSADSPESAKREIAIFFPEDKGLEDQGSWLKPRVVVSAQGPAMEALAGLPADFQLYLASQSPRRRALLREIGLPFEVVPSDAEEREEGGSASDLAEANALAKVRAARLPAGQGPGVFVLGTDTVVVLGRKIMGKPASAEEAAEMLAALSGQTHKVVSGVALARTGTAEGGTSLDDVKVTHASTDVTFAKLAQEQIDGYVASGEWEGKAGGYAVQGLAALFVVGLRGEYSNVVGLPVQVLYGLFREFGVDLLRREVAAGAEGT